MVGGHFPAQKIKIALNNQSQYVLPKIEFGWKRCRKSQSWKSQKIKIMKNCKKRLEILSFYTSVPKIMIMCYTVPEKWRVMDVIVFFHFGLFFALLPPYLAPKINISKKIKKYLEISSFYTSVPKIMMICYTIPEIWCVTDVIVVFNFELFLAHKIKISKKWKERLEMPSFYTCVPKIIRWCPVR